MLFSVTVPLMGARICDVIASPGLLGKAVICSGVKPIWRNRAVTAVRSSELVELAMARYYRSVCSNIGL